MQATIYIYMSIGYFDDNF